MGIYVRKSIRVGPMRFNLSKSGVGASIGMKGLRLVLAQEEITSTSVLAESIIVLRFHQAWPHRTEIRFNMYQTNSK